MISLKMIMDSARNRRWIFPFMKFGMVRVNRPFPFKIRFLRLLLNNPYLHFPGIFKYMLISPGSHLVFVIEKVDINLLNIISVFAETWNCHRGLRHDVLKDVIRLPIVIGVDQSSGLFKTTGVNFARTLIHRLPH